MDPPVYHSIKYWSKQQQALHQQETERNLLLNKSV